MAETSPRSIVNIVFVILLAAALGAGLYSTYNMIMLAVG